MHGYPSSQLELPLPRSRFSRDPEAPLQALLVSLFEMPSFYISRHHKKKKKRVESFQIIMNWGKETGVRNGLWFPLSPAEGQSL